MKVRRLAGIFILVFISGCATGENPKTQIPNPKQIQNPNDQVEKIQLLIKQLDDNSPQVRENATDELVEIGKPAEPYLQETLKRIKGKNAEVEWRVRLIVKLNDIKERVKFSETFLKEFPNIYRDLAKDSVQNRMRVLEQVVRRGENSATDEDVAGIIGEFLSDGGKGLSNRQKLALCSLSGGYSFDPYDGNEDEVIDHFGGDNRTISNWGSAIPSAVPHIAKLINDGDVSVRHTAARIICEISSDVDMSTLSDIVPAVVELLNDSSPDVRLSARNILYNLPAKSTVPHLIKLLGSDDSDTRRSAVDILGRSGAKDAITDVKKLLNDESWSVRAYAGVVLIELGAEDVVPSEVIEDIELLLAWGDEPSERAESALEKIGKLKKKD